MLPIEAVTVLGGLNPAAEAPRRDRYGLERRGRVLLLHEKASAVKGEASVAWSVAVLFPGLGRGAAAG